MTWGHLDLKFIDIKLIIFTQMFFANYLDTFTSD